MKIGIISDSHDNIWKLERAFPTLRQTEAVLHCGDLISPFMINKLKAGLEDIPVHIVWGNNDGDKQLVAKAAITAGTIMLHGDFAELELGGRRIAINHYPEIGRALAASGAYDLVCYGHDHTRHEERVGETLLLNPGEIMGMNGVSSLALYDTQEGEIEWVELGEQGAS